MPPSLQSPSTPNFSIGGIYMLHFIFCCWHICLPHQTELCKIRYHDLLANMLPVPSTNAWRVNCGRINVERSLPHIHVTRCPKPFLIWSSSNNHFEATETISYGVWRKVFAVWSALMPMKSLFFVLNVLAWVLQEKWHLTRQEEGHNDSSKKRFLLLPVTEVRCVEGCKFPSKKVNGLVNQQQVCI